MYREKIIVELATDGAVYTVDGKFIGQMPINSEVYFFGTDEDEFSDDEYTIMFVLEDDEDEGENE